jgi:Ca-activated chloride channel family protein
MAFLWPVFLYFLVIIPLIIAAYIWMLRRRRRYAVRYSSLSLVREALPHQSRLRRHLPFALFMLALAGLLVALARPVVVTTIPTDQTTIVLAMDVSMSMRFSDIQPSRLAAAQQAAMAFIQRQKSTTQIGIVAFSGYAELIQPPTTKQDSLLTSIESLTTGRRTAIGSGILKSIDTIAELDKNVAPSVTDTTTDAGPLPVAPGAYAPEIIVLLTDGVSNTGPLPLLAAKQAADRGVRVYTIGFGTDGGPSGADQFGGGFGGQGGQGGNNGGQGGNGLFGGFFGGGGGFRRGIDETTLMQIAELTGGTYYPAASASELNSVFQKLPTYLITRHETSEISVAFAAFGALLAAAAIVLSQLWHPLP